MAIETRPKNFNFDAGLSPGASKDLNTADAATATNVRWDKEGECRERFPYVETSLDTNIKGTAYGVTDGQNLTYIHESGKYTPGGDGSTDSVFKDSALHPSVRRVVNLGGNLTANRCDCLADGDYLFVCYDYVVSSGVSTQCNFFVVNRNTGEVLAKEITDGTGGSASFPRVAMPGVFVFYSNTTSNLNFVTVDTGSWSWTAPANLLTDKAATSDFKVANDGSNFYVAYANTSNRVSIRKYNSSGVLQGTYAHASLDADHLALLRYAANNRLYLAFDDGTNLNLVRVNESTMVQDATSNLGIGLTTNKERISLFMYDSGGGTYRLAIVVNSPSNSNNTSYVNFANLDLSGGTQTSSLHGLSLHSQFFNAESSNGSYHPMALFSDAFAFESLQPHMVLCNLDPVLTSGTDQGFQGLTPTAILAHDSANPNHGTAFNDYQSTQITESGGKWYTACLVQTGFDTQVVSGTPVPLWGVRVYELDFSPSSFKGFAFHDEQAHVSGGFMWHPEPGGFNESAVVGAPHIKSAAIGGAGSLTGNYSWIVVWEASDNTGKKIRSTSSKPTSLSLTSDFASLFVSEPRFGLAHTDDVEAAIHAVYSAAVYRTQAGGSTYYLLRRIRLTNNTLSNVAISDDTADNLLETGEVLRHGISGLDLGPIVPPASKHVFTWRDRLCLISVEDDTVWYSMPIVPERGAEFNPTLRFQVPGVLIGGAQLNNNVVIFGEREIHVVSGTLGNAAGAGQNVGVQELSRTIGCVNAASIVSTEKGIYFQSQRGLEVLSKDYKINRIRGADDVLRESGRTIASGAFDPDSYDILFPTNDGTTAKVIRVNETNGNVSIDEPDNAVATAIYSLHNHNGTLTGGAVVSGTFKEIQVQAEEVGSQKIGADYNQNGTRHEIRPEYITPWIMEDGPQGEQQVESALFFFRMGSEDGNPRNDIVISQYYDHSETPTVVENFSPSGISANVDSPGIVKIRVTPQKQRCEAIRFRITYNGQSNCSTSLRLINLRLNIGITPGGSRRTSTTVVVDEPA